MDALIGLSGIAIGAVLTAGATYFFDRRKAWTAACGAGLELLADLHYAIRLLDSFESHGVKAAAEVAQTSWPKHRAPLLFRKGLFPTGLKDGQWEHLANFFCEIEVATVCNDDAGTARRAADHASDILGKGFLGRLWSK